MPAQPQTATFPFLSSSLDLKTAAALVGPNKFLQLNNCSLIETSAGRQLQKRNGYLKLTMLDVNGNAVFGGTALETFTTPQSSELDYIGNGTLYSWSPTIGRWIPKGLMPNVAPSERSIAKGGYNKGNPSSAILNGVGVYAWEDAQGGVWFSVIDESSGSAFQNSTQISSTSSIPKVLVVNGAIHIFVCDGSNLVRYSISTTSPATAPTGVTVVSGLQSTNPSFDMVPNNTTVGLAYINSSGKLVVATLNQSTWAVVLTSTTTQSASAVQVVNLNNLTLACILSLGPSAGVSYNFYLLSALTLINAFTDAVTSTVPLATGIQQTATSITVYLQVEPTATVDRIIFSKTVDQNTGIVSGNTIARGVGLASGIWVQGNTAYFLAVFTSTVQQTLFLMSSTAGQSAVTLGKFFPLYAGPFPVSLTGTYGRIPLPTQTSTGIYSFATTSSVATVSVNGKPTYIDGITELVLDYTQFSVHGIQVAQNLHFCGPLAKYYDGQVVAEQNFNVYPEQPVVTQVHSNIGVITTQDGLADTITGTAIGPQPQICQITFPTVPGASGTSQTPPADASLIVPGEYITFAGVINGAQNTNVGSGQAFYVWFSVSGQGNDPVLAGSAFSGKGIQCAINSTDTAAQIAQKFYNATFQGYAGVVKTSGLYTVTLNGTQVTFTAATVVSPSISANSYRSRPASSLKFNVTQTWDGKTSPQTSNVTISCCPGNLITGGQYFTFQITNSSSTSDFNVYAWFTVNGVGTDPAPAGYTSAGVAGGGSSAPIAVLSTDSERQVSAKVKAALLAQLTGTLVAMTNDGSSTPQVIMTTVPTMANPGITAPNFAVNPLAGGVGWGYAGSYINPGSSLGPNLSYQWADIYESVDNQGQLHRSQPSLPATGYFQVYGYPAPYPGGVAPTTVPGQGVWTITSKNLRLTSKTTSDIAIYRTQGNGQLFQRTTSPTALLFNNPLTDFTSYTDSLSDALLNGNEPLYSQVTNGVIPNGPPPAAKFITSHQNRLVFCSLENSQQLVFSQPVVPGFGVAMSPYYSPIQIDPVWGPIMGAASMDGNLIIFTLSNAWVVGGSGPDSTNQGAFTTPQLINSSVGCRDPNSILPTPQGIIFKSLKGTYLLDRKFNAVYIGAPMESLNADVVTDAHVINEPTIVRLGSATGTTLQWDYTEQQWSTFSNHPVNDATIWNNVYYYIRSTDGAVMQENQGSYLDDQTGFSMLATLWWIKPGNLVQGETVVWAFYLKGFFTGNNPFQIDIAIDYNPTSVETHFINPGAGADSSIWGSDATWGLSTPWGGAAAPAGIDLLQYRIQPANDLAEAFQITIQDLAPFQATRSWGLDALDMEFGVIPGLRKLPQAAST